MSEENKEVTLEVREAEKPEGKTSKFLDVIAKGIDILENLPKALTAVLLVISLVGAGTGVYGTFSPDEKTVKNTTVLHTVEDRITSLEVEVRVLKAEKQLLNELVIRLLSAQGLLDGKEIELQSFVIEMPSGKVKRID